MLAHFDRFGDGQEFVESLQTREILASASVEQSSLEKINVEKAECRPEWQLDRNPLYKPPDSDGAGLKRIVGCRRPSLDLQTRLPVRVAIVLFDEDVD